jgi:hypothetical protein
MKKVKNEKTGGFLGLSLKLWIFIVLLCCFFGLILYQSFLVFQKNRVEILEKEALGANISLEFDNNTNVITLEDFTPTKDTVGKTSGSDKYYDFAVNVHLKQASNVHYEISVKKSYNSNIKDEDVRIYLEKRNEFTGAYEPVLQPTSFSPLKASTVIGSPKGSMVLYDNSSKKSDKDHYRLRMWLSDKSTTTSGVYSIELQVNAIAE